MAGNELPPVVARLVADTAEFIAGFREAQAAVASFAMSTIEARDLTAELGAAMRDAGVSAMVADDELVASTDALTAAMDRAAVSADELAVAQDRQATASKDSAVSSDAAKGGLASLGGMATVATLAVVGVAAAGVKMASDFQTATVRLVTSAGEVQSNLKMVQDGILQLSGQVGVSSMELANAMYYVESAGFQGANGLTVLAAAAQGAKAEGASTTNVVKAMTDVLKDYHLPASQAANVTSQMIAAVAHGKTSLEDFSKAFASIVPAASAAGISFADVGSALAEMTNHGFTAQRASQNLAQALRSLLNPTKPMLKAFDDFGVSTDVLKAKLAGPDGLTNAMQYMSDAALKAGKEGTPAFAAALKLLMGTAPGANAALSVVGANMADTTATIKAMTQATADSAGRVRGFAEVQGNFGQTMSRVKDAVGALATKLGLELLPIVTQGAGVFASFLGDITGALDKVGSSVGSFFSHIDLFPVISMFQDLGNVIRTKVIPIMKDIGQTFGPILVLVFGAVVLAVRGLIGVFSAVLAPVKGLFDFMAAHKEAFQAIAVGILAVVGAMKAWALITTVVSGVTKALTAVQAALDVVMALDPIVLIVLAVIALVAAFIYLWQTSSSFRKFWEDLWNGIKKAAEAVGKWFAGPFVHFFEDIGKSIGGFVSDVVKWFKDLPDKIANFFKDLPQKVGFALGFLVGTIAKKAKEAGDAFFHAISTAFDATVKWFKDLPDKILNAIKDPQQWLNTPGMKVIRGLGDGIATAYKDVVKFFKDLPDNIKKIIANASEWLVVHGGNVIKGFVNGIVGAAKDVWHWFTVTLPNSIGGFFKDVVTWLVDAGKNLVMGLIHGIESAIGAVGSAIKSFAGGVVSGFKSAMGISSPSQVMANEVGQHITRGIAQGMLNGMTSVHGAISQIRGAITGASYGTLGTTGGGSYGTYAGLSTGGAGGGTLVITNNIAGTVVGETQLSAVMRTQVLRYNQRNPTNGLSLFGRGNT